MPTITIDEDDPSKSFELTIASGFQPPENEPRADIVFCYYHLKQNGQIYLEGLFDGSWYYDAPTKILILQRIDAYNSLQLIDLGHNTTVICSKIKGGIFKILGIDGRLLKFEKVKGHYNFAFEIELDSLKWIPLKRFRRFRMLRAMSRWFFNC